MRQSLQIDMRVKSENLIRGVDPMALYGMHDAQRKKVTALLTTHIVKPPEVVSGESNQFIVTLCRISAGFLDSEDNLTGAFKHVRDAVGRWLGFKNDSNERLHWRYQQQECVQKSYAIRITIDDLSSGNERDITVGDAPKVLGPPTERCVRLVRKDRKVDAARARAERLAKAQASRANQEALAFRRVFVACPWDLGDGVEIVGVDRLLEFADLVEGLNMSFQAWPASKAVGSCNFELGVCIRLGIASAK
jgi:hypothetical protein